ncbi:hypothetical protein AB0J20_09365 [Micromonospora costi]|uniref:hypothetical protein n=1 Tax=Micromonospora costi TaxID=1530042 RepID=UPI0033CBC66B
MAVHDPGGDAPVAGDAPSSPTRARVPVFVDATGRRRRLMRRCGVALATGTLVYLPIVGFTVLSGPVVPDTPLVDDETGLRIADQPPPPPERIGLPVPPLTPTANHVEEPVPAEPDTAPADPSTPDRTPTPVPDGSGTAAPRPDGSPAPPTPTTASPTRPASPSPSGPLPSPYPGTPPPTVPAGPGLAERLLAR